ncbi:unnamed protein product, partial [Didymodactylos carnosus]
MVNIRIDDDMRSVLSSQQSNENQEEHGEDENMDDDSDENRELEESDEELYEDNFTVGLIKDVDNRSVGENGAIVAFLQNEENEEELTQQLKHSLLKKIKQYVTYDSDQFQKLKLYGYFDPIGFSVLTNNERASIERQIKEIYKGAPYINAQQPPINSTLSSSTTYKTKDRKAKSSLSTSEQFLESVGKEANGTTSKVKPSSVQDEIKIYRQLAAKTVSDETYDKNALSFWRRNCNQIPIMVTKQLQMNNLTNKTFDQVSRIGEKIERRLSQSNSSDNLKRSGSGLELSATSVGAFGNYNNYSQQQQQVQAYGYGGGNYGNQGAYGGNYGGQFRAIKSSPFRPYRQYG